MIPVTKNKVLIAGAILLVGLAGFGIYKLTRKSSSASNILDDTIKDLDPKKVSISAAQAQDLANRLYLAMKDMGTDETEIEDILFKKNNLSSEDIVLISKAFGTKKYNQYGSPMFDWMGGDDLDLREWLRRECSANLNEKIDIKFRQAGFLGIR